MMDGWATLHTTSSGHKATMAPLEGRQGVEGIERDLRRSPKHIMNLVSVSRHCDDVDATVKDLSQIECMGAKEGE